MQERRERQVYGEKTQADYGSKLDRLHFRQLQQRKVLAGENELAIHTHERNKEKAFTE